MNKKFDENFVAKNVAEIIEKLGISATLEVAKTDSTFFVDIDSEDSSLLIGKNGINLESLQFVLAVRLKSTSGQEDFEIFVDVDGWRKQKEEKLARLAQTIAENVATSGKPETLYNLKAFERKVIHTTLSDHPQVATISEGEGQERHLIIKPKAA